MKKSGLISACVIVVLLAVCGAFAQEKTEKLSLLAAGKVLKARNIEATAEGLKKFLSDTIGACNCDQEKIKQLVAQLADKDWKRRDEASRTLMDIPILPENELRKALDSDDMEVRVRIENILSRPKEQTIFPTVQAAMVVIKGNKIGGLVGDMIDICRTFPGNPELLAAANDAIVKTAQESDLDALRKAAKMDSSEMKMLAVAGIIAALGDKAGAELVSMLEEKDEVLVMKVAELLADSGSNACLPALVRMLDSKSAQIAGRAKQILVAITGQDFPDSNKKSKSGQDSAKWKAWVEKEGAKAQLAFPISKAMGRLIVLAACQYSGGNSCVMLYDISGNLTNTISCAPTPWAIQMTSDGTFIVGTEDKALREYTIEGKVVWELKDLPGDPMDVQRLPNGNTLVALVDGKKGVLEYSKEGKIVWDAKVEGRTASARRLENGNTLITVHRIGGRDGKGKVIEVDKDGKTVWSVEDLDDPQQAQRLANGNTVVGLCEGCRVVELDKDGKEVWSKGEPGAGMAVMDMQRLANGNTVICGPMGIKEIDSNGSVVWETSQSSISRISKLEGPVKRPASQNSATLESPKAESKPATQESPK